MTLYTYILYMYAIDDDFVLVLYLLSGRRFVTDDDGDIDISRTGFQNLNPITSTTKVVQTKWAFGHWVMSENTVGPEFFPCPFV